MSRNRRGKRKKVIELGLEGIVATVVADGQARVLIKVTEGKTLFHGKDDRCIYRLGYQQTCPENGAGSEGSCFLGCTYSLQPGVIDLQFRNHNGVFVRVNLYDPDLINNLKNLAIMMLNRADAFARLLDSTNP